MKIQGILRRFTVDLLVALFSGAALVTSLRLLDMNSVLTELASGFLVVFACQLLYSYLVDFRGSVYGVAKVDQNFNLFSPSVMKSKMRTNPVEFTLFHIREAKEGLRHLTDPGLLAAGLVGYLRSRLGACEEFVLRLGGMEPMGRPDSILMGFPELSLPEAEEHPYVLLLGSFFSQLGSGGEVRVISDLGQWDESEFHQVAKRLGQVVLSGGRVFWLASEQRGRQLDRGLRESSYHSRAEKLMEFGVQFLEIGGNYGPASWHIFIISWPPNQPSVIVRFGAGYGIAVDYSRIRVASEYGQFNRAFGLPDADEQGLP